MLTRRDFIRNAGSLLLIPAVVRAESLMKIFVPPKPFGTFAGTQIFGAPGVFIDNGIGDDHTAFAYWQIDEKQNIRFIGPKDHPKSSVVELYKWLGDVSRMPARMDGNVLTLPYPLNIDDNAAKQLTEGAVVQKGGLIIYQGIESV